jgi:hypothetical protein
MHVVKALTADRQLAARTLLMFLALGFAMLAVRARLHRLKLLIRSDGMRGGLIQ